MLRDGRFRWSAVIVLGLLAVALASGWSHYRSVSAQHEAAQAATREQWLAQGEKNPHSAAHYGVYAFKPKMPLSLVDQGVDSYVGVATWLEAHRQNDFLYRPAQDGTVAQRLGELTAAGVLQLLIPLLVILLAFGTFAGEREQGTLRQLLSLGVSRRDLAAGKALGIAGGMALLLVPAAIIGVLALTLATSSGTMATTTPRMLLLAGAYLLYFGIFVAISLAVSARAPSSRLALVGLLGFWIVNSLVAPRAVTDVAKRFYPAPSAFAFQQQVDRDVREGIDGRTPQAQRNEELRRQVLAQYGVGSIEELPVNFSGISLQAGEEYANLVYDKNWGEVWTTYERQNRVHQAGSLLAPLLAIRSFSMGMAGTDFEQHRDFAAAAEEYRRMLNLAMNEHIAENIPPGQPPVADEDLWEQVPPFEYQAPSLASVLGGQGWSLAFLLGWLLVGTAVAARSARRLPVD